MASKLFALAGWAVRRRRAVLAGWVLAVAVAVGLGVTQGGETSNLLDVPGTESQEASDLLSERFPANAGSSAQVVVVAPEGRRLDDAAVAAEVEAVLAEAAGRADVAGVVSPAEADAIAADGRTGVAQVLYDLPASQVPVESAEELLALARPGDADSVRVEVGGEVPASVTGELGHTSEVIGLSVALVVLLIVFGSLVAAGLPLVTGLLGVMLTYAGIALAANLVDLPSTTATLALMIGLAVGIDYALFIVSRHREQLAAGDPVDLAAATATATAGSAVVFAGLSVIIAIAGLAVVGIPFVTAMGLAAAGGVLVAVAIAVTLTPALLSFAGPRVVGRRERTGTRRAPARTVSERWAAVVVRRPVTSLVGALVVLGVLAVPVVSLRLGFPDDASLPDGSTRKASHALIADAFGPGANSPLTLAVDLRGAPDPEAALGELEAVLTRTEGVAEVAPATSNRAGDTAVVVVVPDTGPADEDTTDTVERIRDGVAEDVETTTGARLLVTGATAVNIDVSAALTAALVPFLLLVLGLMLVLLVSAFRSILIALKAVVAISLSVGASFGVLVAVFQWGWLGSLIGVDERVPIVSFLPLIMFAILFGLSMDYEVFILSRVKERISAGDTAERAVLHGIGASARVITAAAAIMIAVFGSFVGQTDPTIKMFGLGLGVAVLLDATIVRMVFVPAALQLLGERAWRLPRRLDRLVPDLDIEGHRLQRPAAAVPADPDGTTAGRTAAPPSREEAGAAR